VLTRSLIRTGTGSDSPPIDHNAALSTSGRGADDVIIELGRHASTAGTDTEDRSERWYADSPVDDSTSDCSLFIDNAYVGDGCGHTARSPSPARVSRPIAQRRHPG
jgi:hypothetical protein